MPGAAHFRHRDDLLPGAVVSACAYESSGHARGRPPRAAVAVDHLHRLGRRAGAGVRDGRRGRPVRPRPRHVVRRLRGGPAPGRGPGRAARRAARRPARPAPARRAGPAGLPGRGAGRAGGPRSRGARPGRAPSCTSGSARAPTGRSGSTWSSSGCATRVDRGAGVRRCDPSCLGLAAARRRAAAGAGSRTSPAQVALSPRQLRALMVAETGLSPKQLARQFRFDTVIARLADGAPTAWPRSPRRPGTPTRPTSPASSGRWPAARPTPVAGRGAPKHPRRRAPQPTRLSA